MSLSLIRRVSLFVCLIGLSVSVDAQTLLTNVPVAERPNAVAFNPATHKLYTVLGQARTLVETDVQSLVSTEIPLQTPANDVALPRLLVNPLTNTIFVTNVIDNNVLIVSGETHEVVSVQLAKHPTEIALNVSTNRLYIAMGDLQMVAVLDGATHHVRYVPVGRDPGGIAVNPVSNRIYVTNTSSDTVTVIDGRTLRTTTLPVGQYPYEVVVNVVSNKVYVANLRDSTLAEIDGVTNAVTTFPVGDSEARFPFHLALNGQTNRLYVSFQTLGAVAVIDTVTHVQTLVPVDVFIFDVAVDTTRDRLYFVAYPDQLGTLDGATGQVTYVTTGGFTAWDVAVDPLANVIAVADAETQDVAIFAGVDDGAEVNLLDAILP